MNKGGPRPSEALQNFTDREKERDVFVGYMNAPEGSTLPVVMFYGVGGIGKTWLMKRLRQLLGEPPFVNLPGQQAIPSVRLDMDSNGGGARYQSDPANAYAEIRRQLAVECPSFDLAYAMLRYKQGVREEAEFRHGGAFQNAWEFITEAGNTALSSVPGGNLILWAVKKVTPHIGREFEETALGKHLLSATGNKEYFELRDMDIDVLYQTLPQRLGSDLDAHLPVREGKACRGVLFIDTYEAMLAGVENAAQQYERAKWIVNLYENLNHVCIVIAGRDRLTWAEADADWQQSGWLEQLLMGGLSRQDAETFLGWSGVTDGELQRAVLRVCVDREAPPGAHGDTPYHPYSLGLCADTIIQERNRGVESDPQTFDMAPGDYDRLAQRFLKSLANDAEADWIARLSLPPRFDEAAARHGFSPTPGAVQNAAWKNLQEYSFVSERDADGWRTLHPRMREALRKRLSDPSKPGDARNGHLEWRAYWQSRRQNDTDDYAALAWYHRWYLEPQDALKEWDRLAERARSAARLDMVLHYRMLDWWLPVGIAGQTGFDAAHALNNLGVELNSASLGNRNRNLQRAIEYYHVALRVRTEADFPEQWAATQNNLGDAYSNLPLGDRGQNLQQAIDYYTAALRVRTEADFPIDWAATQNNLGLAYSYLPGGDRSRNLQQAVGCYEAALRIYARADFPVQWAMLQNNLGLAYSNLPLGDRGENLQRAITCYKAALQVRTEADFPVQWAMLQNNLGDAYSNLPLGDRGQNLQQAIDYYTAALRVRTEADFPIDWAATQHNLGDAYSDLPIGDRGQNLQRAIEYYHVALRVRTEADFPAQWAATQNNLGNAFSDLTIGDRSQNLQQAIGYYEAALRISTEADFPRDWAMLQNNLGLAYYDLPAGERDQNLQQAIAYYEAALRISTEAAFPRDWAMTQSNLGNAYSDLTIGDRSQNLQRAIGCYEAALRVYTEADFPEDWARTWFNLALMREDAGDRADARRAMQQAVVGYRQVGMSAEVAEAEEWLQDHG